MNEGMYYLRLNGKVDGPYSIGQIYDLWAARKINSQTLFARFEEMDKWQPLSELTLKISAPKSTLPKIPVPESAPSPLLKQKTSLSPRTEDYVPPMVYQVEQPPAAAQADRPRAFPALAKKVLGGFSYPIAFCIGLGTCITAYSLWFSSASPEGKEVSQGVAIMKQNGVIAGMGLVLMGGLLIVARQMNQLLIMLKGEPSNRADRKKPHTST